MVGDGRIDMGRDEPHTLLDGWPRFEGGVLVRAAEHRGAGEVGLAVIHPECLEARIEDDQPGELDTTVARTKTACFNGKPSRP